MSTRSARGTVAGAGVGLLVGLLAHAPALARPNAPPVAVAGGDFVVVAGERVRLDGRGSHDVDGNLIRWHWDLGDGHEVSDAVVSHVYWAPGRYRVRLEVTDDSGRPNATSSATATVTVTPRPNALPVADAGPERTVRVGEPVRFDGGGSVDPDGALVGYRWHFGDGTVARGRSPLHAFQRAGVFEVTVEVEDRRGALASDRTTVTVQPRPNVRPVAAAGGDRVVAPGEAVVFDGTGSTDADGALIGWRWDLGDGTRASGPLVTHRYGAPGRYTVRLTVEDGSGRPDSRGVDTAEVHVNAPPVADAGTDLATRDAVVRFDAGDSTDPDGHLVDHEWDFGDGGGARGVRVDHAYERPGTYRARLTVTDSSGAANGTAADERVVTILEGPLAVANAARSVAVGETVLFDGRASSRAPLEAFAYRWDLGDGTWADGAAVRKAYAQPGLYRARLILAARSGDPLATASDEISVRVNAPPTADAGPDRWVAPGETVLFDPGASIDPEGEPLTFTWNFDVAAPAIGGIVERSFAEPGAYRARLTVDDGSGAANARATDDALVRVNHPPRAAFQVAEQTGLRTVVLDAGRSSDADGDALSYRWSFGDGSSGSGRRVTHTYAAGGGHEVRLEVDDGRGLTNSRVAVARTVRLNQRPVADAGGDIRVCAADALTLDASASTDADGDPLAYVWRIGDAVVERAPQVTLSLREPGFHLASVTVDDGTGLANAADTDRVRIHVDARPLADAGGDRTVCAREAVRFDGTGSSDLDGVVNSFAWSFGDGRTGGGDRPIHLYERAGVYALTLRIEGDPLPRCDSVSIDRATVTVIPSPAARIRAPRLVAPGDVVVFDASPSSAAEGVAITSHRWRFGDGTGAEGRVVEHRFEQPGAYEARLDIDTDVALRDCARADARVAITVNAPPVADAGEDLTVVAGEAVTFDGTGSHDPDGLLRRHAWTFGDGEVGEGATPTHTYGDPGVYEAVLTVTDDTALSNNEAADTVTVTVAAAPALTILGPAASCPGDPVRWAADVDARGRLVAAGVRWHLGDGTRAELPAVTHVYRQPGTYQVTLDYDALDAGRHVSRSATRWHRVNASPVARAGPDRASCVGAAVTFDGRRSYDPDGTPVAHRWRFGDGREAEGAVVDHVYELAGLYAAELTVDDGSDLACGRGRDRVGVRVNAQPVAHAGPPLEVRLGAASDAAVLDAAGSRDPDGDSLGYFWEIDGEVMEGRRVVFRPTAPGTYPARLTVTDGLGLPCSVATAATVVHVIER